MRSIAANATIGKAGYVGGLGGLAEFEALQPKSPHARFRFSNCSRISGLEQDDAALLVDVVALSGCPVRVSAERFATRNEPILGAIGAGQELFSSSSASGFFFPFQFSDADCFLFNRGARIRSGQCFVLIRIRGLCPYLFAYRRK